MRSGVGAGKGPGWQLKAPAEETKDKQGQDGSPGCNPGQLTSSLGTSVSLFVTWGKVQL